MPTPKPGLQTCSSLLCVWQDTKTVVHWFHGKAIIVEIYCQQLNRINELLCRKCRSIMSKVYFFGKQKVSYSPVWQCKVSLWKTNRRTKWDHEDGRLFYIFYTYQILYLFYLFWLWKHFRISETFRSK